ncbi:MAG: 50S ribosomal protein L21 [Omnitrophica WOR_2 bacterium RIFCSPHIGHO2_02_FULL_52_10]|nr:MAG: 50S ribosomal protein L21 [Omnitrophica WOR_2 bacterium RIFCSPHIGHO2_02_FULL_52_10]
MYAVVQIGATQFKISEGDIIDADRIPQEPGKNVTLDKVLLFAKGADVRIGQPYLKDVKVTAEVVRHNRGKKKVAFKFRRRKSSQKKIGHRQNLTVLNITKIMA